MISSPSGAGKTSICKKLLELDDKIRPSIALTTRKPRNNETDGVDYIFTSIKEFDKSIKLSTDTGNDGSIIHPKVLIGFGLSLL